MPSGVYTRTDWHKEVTRNAMIGRKLSVEHRQHISSGVATVMPVVKLKISAALKGKSKSPEHVEKVRLANLGKKRSTETRLRLSVVHSGKKQTAAHIKAATLSRIGLKRSPEFCATLSKRMRENSPMRGLTGERHPRWIADRSKLVRAKTSRSAAHLYWSKAVRRKFKICVLTNTGGCFGNLAAHHIKDFASYPELRYDVRNGVTLCHAHHPRKQSEVIAQAPLFEAIVAQKG